MASIFPPRGKALLIPNLIIRFTFFRSQSDFRVHQFSLYFVLHVIGVSYSLDSTAFRCEKFSRFILRNIRLPGHERIWSVATKFSSDISDVLTFIVTFHFLVHVYLRGQDR